jgi:putative iron-only hydrogenase system regulator
MKKRGIIGIMVGDWESDASKVNVLIGEHRLLIKGRMGVPDHEANIGTIALIIEAEPAEIDQFNCELAKIASVKVSTIFAKDKDDGGSCPK